MGEYFIALVHKRGIVSLLKLRSSMTSSNRPLRATVGQNSSSVQMASANHVGAAVLVHVARSGRLDDVIDERSFRKMLYINVQYSSKIDQLLFYKEHVVPHFHIG